MYKFQMIFFANYEIQHTALQQATNKFYLYQIMKVYIWKENEERDLIQLRIEMEEQFNDVKNHDVLWPNNKKNILNSHNIFCDCITSETNGKTWRKLKVVDDNSQTGNKAAACKFFEKFDNVYGNRASTRAELIYDSSANRNLLKANNTDGVDSSTDSNSWPKRAHDW